MTASEHFTKFVPVTVAGVDKRRRDDAERRGAHHNSTPYQRGEEAEPYVSGSTTTQGSTSAANVDEGITDDDARDEYPRRRKRPRDNQSIAKRLDVRITGKDCHAKVLNALAAAFPHKADALRSIGKGCKEIVITGVGARQKVLDVLRQLGGKIETT
jgi:hypothetical protein